MIRELEMLVTIPTSKRFPLISHVTFEHWQILKNKQ